ncbi:MAG TPA: efflux RND transporter periplasmic adaptor subunit [Steroidobacteraceae bacterium]|nr:efflux RND transporter periplasmic adaptor subunit [Steroidobacteraceae bacterium]
MTNYRSRFRVALAAIAVLLVLLAIAAVGWWRMSPPAPALHARPPANASSPAAADPSSPSAPNAPSDSAGPKLGPVQLSPQRLQSIGVKTGKVESRLVSDHIITTGNVAIDETKLAYVQVRFSGYIQKVYVDSTYQHVRRGEPLFTIYSPDLVSTEREYLLAERSQRQLARSADPEVARDAASLVHAARARLAQWGIPAREIKRLASSGKVQQALEIDSPASGYVTEREALPNKYADPSTRLYTIADLSTIWVFAQVFQNDLGRIKVGDPATLTVDTYPGRTFSGRVDFIYPDVDMTTRTARVRLKFANSDVKLMPGMFVNISLDVPMGRHEVIPASGVLETGTRQIVFVDHGGGYLEPREVELGARVGDDYIVMKGLEAGERIVTSANFLIDSESQLQAALGSFAPPPPGAGAAGASNASQAAIELSTDPNPPRTGRNGLRVKLTTAKGAPIAGAQVTATFFMAAMPAMGMAAHRVAAQLADRGSGAYEGSIELPGGGAWQVTVVAQKSGETIAMKQLSVAVAGGM